MVGMVVHDCNPRRIVNSSPYNFAKTYSLKKKKKSKRAGNVAQCRSPGFTEIK